MFLPLNNQAQNNKLRKLKASRKSNSITVMKTKKLVLALQKKEKVVTMKMKTITTNFIQINNMNNSQNNQEKRIIKPNNL